MARRWTVTLGYLGYAVLLLLCAAAWLATLFDHIVYGRVEEGLLDERWLEIAWAARREAETALALALGGGGLALLLALAALLPAAPPAPLVRAHGVYQAKSAGILLCLLGLVALARNRMGALDADLAAVAFFAWGLWAVAAGWSAHARGVAVSGPAGWGLALAAAVLSVAGLALLVFLIWLEGGIRVF